MLRSKGTQGGQALLMVTLSLFAMCGLMGLAIDFGWSFFIHKEARAAADSAALAAVKAAFAAMPKTPPFSCMTTGITCTTNGPVDCSAAPAGNLATGCQFAQQNGFSSGGNGSRQTLTIEANVPPFGCRLDTPPDCAITAGNVNVAPGVAAAYWVHVVATESIPQLFSAIYGNLNGVVSADATAALAEVVVPGSFIGLDREFDPGLDAKGKAAFGVDLGLHGTIVAPNGMFLASSCPTGGKCSGSAGQEQGATSTITGTTYLRTGAQADWCGAGTGTGACQSVGDSSNFSDPYAGLGQPKLVNFPDPAAATSYHAVPLGQLNAGMCNPSCPSGYYYSLDVNGKANGAPVRVAPGVTFGSSSTFGSFMFLGGLATQSGGGNALPITFGPGEYVAAGYMGSGACTAGNCILDFSSGGVVGGNGSDAGRIFITTNLDYPGMAGVQAYMNNSQNVPSTVLWNDSAFKQGSTQLLSNGNADNVLYGLNPDSALVPAALTNFGSVAFWQDQQNSNVKYKSDGTVDNSVSCGGDGGDKACANPNPSQISGNDASGNPNDPQLYLKAGNKGVTGINGAVYQPRGATAELDATANITSAIQLITGNLILGVQGGNPSVTLVNPAVPLAVLKPVLVH